MMGGIGSGRRWHYGTKDTTGDFRSIDVRRWQRDGFLRPGYAFGWQWTTEGKVSASIQVRVESSQVRLIYRHRRNGSDWKDENYAVRLEQTKCNLGGQRTWFLCPARGCGRRVALLYGGEIFACRHCYRLAYPSQNERPPERLLRKARKIRGRVASDADLMLPFPPRPKGQWTRTYLRLREKGTRAERDANSVFLLRMRKLMGHLEHGDDDGGFW